MKKPIVAIIFLFTVMLISSFALADLTTVSYTTYDTSYDAIIKMYIRVMNAYGDDGHRHDLYNGNARDYLPVELPESQLYTLMKQSVGYSIYDLNNDGVDELIIGLGSSSVLEVFTMDNGKVRELMRGIARYNIALMTEGRFYRYNNAGGGSASSTVWTMNGTGPVSYVEGYFQDDNFGSYYDEKGYHYYDYQWFRLRNPNKWESTFENKVSAKEYLTWLKEQDQQLLQLSFIPLAVVEKGISSEHTGIISVKGKTNGRDYVNIRSKASKKSKLVKSAKTGTYVEILGQEDDYYKIRISGKEGYIQKDFLVLPGETVIEQKASIYDPKSAEYFLKIASEENIIPGKPVATYTPKPNSSYTPKPVSAPSDLPSGASLAAAFGNYKISIVNLYLLDYGNPLVLPSLVLQIQFSNSGSQAKAFTETASIEVSQGGIVLVFEGGILDDKNTKIKNGGQIIANLPYYLRDLTTPIEICIYEGTSGSQYGATPLAHDILPIPTEIRNAITF